MLFRLGIKEDPAEFYNYKKELDLYVTGISDELTRLIVIKGIRRIGKSSLTRVGISIAKPYLYMILDPRSLPVVSGEAVADILARGLKEALRKQRRVRKLFERAVARVESISIAGVSIRVNRRNPLVLTEFLDSLNEELERVGEYGVIVIDEAQELINTPRIQAMLAHIYDYDRRVKLVLTGSQVGLLDRLLRTNDPDAPLYGRPVLEIKMHRLSRRESIGFLVEGFREVGMDWRGEWIEEAVDTLDGIPGWLTAYGYYSYTYRSHDKALEATIRQAVSLVRNELQRFLASRGVAVERYKAILYCLSLEPMNWSRLWRCVETRLASRIPKTRFAHYLRELASYSFIEKTSEGMYKFSDPLVSMVARRF